MPAYDYRCTSCDLVFELRRAHADATPVICPSCGSATKRIFTPVGVVFKGSGFHTTDYRPKPKSEEPSPSEKGPCAPAVEGAGCASCPAQGQSTTN
jgi:putative FmdB family regulatory protein